MKKNKKVLMLAVLLALALALLSGCGEEKAESEDEASGFGSFTSETFDGTPVSEEIFENADVTMINVWGTFCSPCLQEMPDLEKISQKYGSEKFQLLGLVSDSDVPGDKNVEQIIEKTGVTYTQVMNSAELSSGILGAVQAVPTTIFVDDDGEILKVAVGAKSYGDWEKIVEEVLKTVE